MLHDLIDSESRGRRLVYFCLALLLVAGFFYSIGAFWVPAHPGTDQNGYLVGAKLVSRSLTMRYAPTRPGTAQFDPHQFVGNMWVGADLGTPAESYYPKYPIGLPLIYAVTLWIGALFKPGIDIWLVYWVNPLAMSLAIVATFLLSRLFAGSFLAFLTAAVFASSPVTFGLATNPNSHATAVCCVTWGMYFLFTYWRTAGRSGEKGERREDKDQANSYSLHLSPFSSLPPTLSATAAGVLLGYAATIRYSEGALILPIALVAWFALSRERLGTTVALLLGWAIPVGLLILYNRGAMGTNTGYDPTHESKGFGLTYAVDNWETMLRHLDTNGLSMLLPLSLAALVWMFWWNWRVASVLTAWIGPCMVIYMFYYWAPDNTNISYLRFFLTILPALAICFFWFIRRLHDLAQKHAIGRVRARLALPISILAALLALPMFWMLSMHVWLGDFAPATVGLHSANRLLTWLTPADTDADAIAISAAHAALAATITWAIVGACVAGLISLALHRGRNTLPIIGGGLLAGLVMAMHLTNALPAAEADQLTRSTLAFNVDELRSLAPNGSVILCTNDPLLNDLQFAGDYDLYNGRSFSRDWVQHLPNADPPDMPQGLDPGRRDALFARLKGMDQSALDQQAREIITGALAHHRRVFVVAERADIEPSLRHPHDPNADAKTQAAYRQVLIRAMPDFVRRVCTSAGLNDQLSRIWVMYVPRLTSTSATPRGLRLPRIEPVRPRLMMEVIEISNAVL
ncbi:MAG: hypothetical protein JO353_09350 [Phycisphaerae bacterium]|nr:hypothetical protein [Phycisphaerae bacterium]